MEYLVRFAQSHENFREPEIKALATLAGVDMEIVSYNHHVSHNLRCACKLQVTPKTQLEVTKLERSSSNFRREKGYTYYLSTCLWSIQGHNS